MALSPFICSWVRDMGGGGGEGSDKGSSSVPAGLQLVRLYY